MSNQTRTDQQQSLSDMLTVLLSRPGRDLVVTGLQALHRERVAAWNAASVVAFSRDQAAPDMEMFGLDEVSDMLRKLGAAPH